MMDFHKSILFVVLLILIVGAMYNHYPPETAVAKIARSRGAINIDDPNLKYEVVASGLKSPTTMAEDYHDNGSWLTKLFSICLKICFK
jgi:hypothetical protein